MSAKIEAIFRDMEQLAKSQVIMMHEDVRQGQLDKIELLHKQFSEEYCRRKTGEEVGEIMERFINVMSNREENKKFVQKIVHGTHRTLNQGLIGLFLDVIKEEATLADTKRWDGRNEASVVICKRIEPLINDYYLPFI